MTLDELKERIASLKNLVDVSAAKHNMLLGRLQESEERLSLFMARAAEAAEKEKLVAEESAVTMDVNLVQDPVDVA